MSVVSAYKALGITAPGSDYRREWDTVRSLAARALGVIAEEIRQVRVSVTRDAFEIGESGWVVTRFLHTLEPGSHTVQLSFAFSRGSKAKLHLAGFDDPMTIVPSELHPV